MSNSMRWSRTVPFVCAAIVVGAQDRPSPHAPAVPLDAIDGILDAFRSHQVVGIGDAHGNVQGEALRLLLIRDPRFASAVDDVLVELGNSRHQALMDEYTDGRDVAGAALRRVWHDTAQQQAAPYDMPAVFRTVREVNATLPADRRAAVSRTAIRNHLREARAVAVRRARGEAPASGVDAWTTRCTLASSESPADMRTVTV
jgi:hypothetical protein